MRKSNSPSAFGSFGLACRLLPVALAILISVTSQSASAATTINVKSFGAKGDGITDDQTSIQNAFNSAQQSGATVFFPKGIYLHSDILVANGIGINSDRAQLVATVSTRPTLALGGKCTISNLSIQSRVEVPSPVLAALSITDGSDGTKLSKVTVGPRFRVGVMSLGINTTVSECTFSGNTPDDTLFVCSGDRTLFSKCSFLGSRNSNQSGLTLSGAKNLRVTETRFLNLDIAINDSGLLSESQVDTIQIDHNHISAVNFGIGLVRLDPAINVTIKDNEIVNVNRQGIILRNAQRALIDSNRLLNIPSGPIILVRADGVEISRNTVANSNTYAVVIQLSETNSVVRDNTIKNAGGVYVNGNTGALAIYRNSVANTALVPEPPIVIDAVIKVGNATVSNGPITITKNNYRGNSAYLTYFIWSIPQATLVGNTTTATLPSKVGP